MTKDQIEEAMRLVNEVVKAETYAATAVLTAPEFLTGARLNKFEALADLRAHLEGCGGVPEGWRDIATAPTACAFLACIEVQGVGKKETWWEQHVLYLDDEDGSIHPDHHQGWELEDYAAWRPLPLPPAPSAAMAKGEGA